MQNPRLTENEVEKIASMRSVPEEVLRQIAGNRNWARNYLIVHNLARNPRTPIANAMNILSRLQLRDLVGLSKTATSRTPFAATLCGFRRRAPENKY